MWSPGVFKTPGQHIEFAKPVVDRENKWPGAEAHIKDYKLCKTIKKTIYKTIKNYICSLNYKTVYIKNYIN